VPTKTISRAKLRRPAPQVLTVATWAEFPWLVHGFSTRPGGLSKVYGGASLNLGFTKEDRRKTVERNREVFFRGLGAVDEAKELMPVVTLRQIHSDLIHTVAAVPEAVLVGDGMITDIRGLILGVQTAIACLSFWLIRNVKRLGCFTLGGAGLWGALWRRA